MGRPKGIPWQGHQNWRGLRKWQKVHATSMRNRRTFHHTHEAWARFKTTAGIHQGLTVAGALKKLKAAGCRIDYRTLINLINGLTDTKLSTAMDLCETWDCSLDGFGRAMLEGWEIAERRWATEQAMKEALSEPGA